MEASIYRIRLRDVLMICVLALLALGFVMVQSASTSLNGCIVHAPPVDPGSAVGGEPPPLMNVMAATATDGIDITWDTDTDTNVVRYHVYRATAEDENYQLVQTLNKPARRWHDATAAINQPSMYRVAAVNRLNHDGPVSQFLATRPGRWSWTGLASRHLLFAIVAFSIFLGIGHINPTLLRPSDGSIWKSPAAWLLVVAALACVAVLLPGIGSSVNGARRWIKFGPIQLQPSELAKWATVLFLAWWLTRPAAQTGDFFCGFLPTLIPVAMLCLLVVIQDFGTAALIAICALTMLLAGRVKWWHVAIVAVPVGLAAFWFIAHKSYRLKRIMAFRDPYASPQGDGYHMIQSLLSFSTGGVFGRGLGNGIQKLGYLPEDTTDFIFAIISEELGLFGALLTVALYLGVLYVAWQTIKQKRDDFGRMLAFGIGSMLGLQAAINIAVATVSVPTKGLSLPLISAGGSGLIITCAALGLLYNVAQTEPREDRAPEPMLEKARAQGTLLMGDAAS